MRENGELPPWVEQRLRAALQIAPSSRQFVACLSFGTVHKPPPLDRSGFPISESRAAARWLVERGVRQSELLVEDLSLDTIGNAYYLRLLHVEPLRLRRIHVITNRFHLQRTEFIFRKVFSLDKLRVTLSFQAVDDVGLSSAELALRTQVRRRGAGEGDGSPFVCLLRSRVHCSANWIRCAPCPRASSTR